MKAPLMLSVCPALVTLMVLVVAPPPVSVYDLHATMLNRLGIDHSRLSHKFQGLDARLTGVDGAKVIKKIMA
ncbi:DUF1501 domain-containing protein [Phragmitibacter flavus]|uniref:DUF1501 domain-containing protein n=1 Tax=Phragmitibacter flavus TaxID=2576071 RepID=UPI001F0F2AF5|nr:DUF1501 domain-containing protein [Phragmitibacter flavus]